MPAGTAILKNRSKVACTVCRTRKTRCDGRRPKCTFCEQSGNECKYETTQYASVEANIEQILNRLSAIENRLNGGIRDNTIVTALSEPDNSRHLNTDLHSSFGHPYLSIKDDKFTNLILNFNFDLKNNLSLHSRTLELQRPNVYQNNGLMAIIRHNPDELVQLFFRHTYKWYPILSKKTIFTEKLPPLLQNTLQLGGSTDAFLMLMVLAIGALNSNDTIGRFQANEFHAQAMSMLSCVLEELSLQSVQCLILICIYYGLQVMPMKAQEYVTIGASKMQNLIEIRSASVDNKPSLPASPSLVLQKSNEEKTYGLEEYETRAFWALFILESEYSGALHFGKSDLSSYASSMPFPSLIEEPYHWAGSPSASSGCSENSRIDDGDQPDPHFLSEIGIRKIIDRTCYTFSNNISNSSVAAAAAALEGQRTYFAPIVAKELQLQLEKWYMCLPNSLKFDSLKFDYMNMNTNKALHQNQARAVHSSLPFIAGQYYAAVMLIYWPCMLDIITTGQCNDAEHQEAFKIEIDAYVNFMKNATSVQLFELPLIWTHAVSIFVNTAAIMRMTSRTAYTYDKPEELSKAIDIAFAFLESIDSSPSIRFFDNILRDSYNHRKT